MYQITLGYIRRLLLLSWTSEWHFLQPMLYFNSRGCKQNIEGQPTKQWSSWKTARPTRYLPLGRATVWLNNGFASSSETSEMPKSEWHRLDHVQRPQRKGSYHCRGQTRPCPQCPRVDLEIRWSYYRTHGKTWPDDIRANAERELQGTGLWGTKKIKYMFSLTVNDLGARS